MTRRLNRFVAPAVRDNLRNEHGVKMHSWEMKMAFGLRPEDKWPADGMGHRFIGNVLCWVISRREAKDARLFHRVMACCPHCLDIMSAGRLHQHLGTKTCSAV